MADAGWIGYAGLITGAIGSITGIVGTITGCIAYRQSNKLKTLDLRLQLRKADADLPSAVHGLLPLLERARTSRHRVAAATGLRKSGAIEAWDKVRSFT